MLGFLNKLFGSKSERDIKQIQPLLQLIKEEYPKLQSLTDDELRQKTASFKTKIRETLAELDSKVAELKSSAENPELPIHDKTAIYDEIDRLNKDRDKQLEVVLLEILPEAFAVVKETAKRFTENKALEVTATQFDRDLAARKNNVVIQG